MINDLVYVIDDVESNRLLAQAYLERLGWQVRTFEDASSVLAAVEENVPEAMLIDVRMPGFCGDLLATMLRAKAETAQVRLVGYTAHAMPDEIPTLCASGFDEILIKPVLMADMMRVLPRHAGAAD
jgi:CheY-like chemotaxis protein